MFILAGGADLQSPDYGKRLAAVIKNEIDEPVILSCLFAVLMNDRAKVSRKFEKWFKDNFGNDCQVLHASETLFLKQIEDAHVIYLHGGSTDLLLDALSKFNNLEHAFKGKIIIGSSAGANFLSHTGFSPTKNKIIRGSGIVDVGVVVHYGVTSFHGHNYDRADWKRKRRDVHERAKGRDVLLLPEGEFVIIDSNENH